MVWLWEFAKTLNFLTLKKIINLSGNAPPKKMLKRVFFVSNHNFRFHLFITVLKLLLTLLSRNPSSPPPDFSFPPDSTRPKQLQQLINSDHTKIRNAKQFN